MRPPIHEAEHHGIPVRWVDIPGPLRATLTIGVGYRDEPPQLMGITRLVEQLLLRALGTSYPWETGNTSAGSMSFSSVGSPEVVVRFLNDLTRVMSDPRFEDGAIELQRRILEAERPQEFGYQAGPLTYRFGLGDVGNTGVRCPTVSSITVDEARHWISTWCITGNAALTFGGPIPEGLDVALPPGSAEAHRRRTPELSITQPTLVAMRSAGVRLSLLVPVISSRWMRDALMHRLRSDLRETRGLICRIEQKITSIDEATDQLDLFLVTAEDDAEETAPWAVKSLRSAAKNIDETTLAVVQTEAETAMSRPEVWFEFLLGEATAALRGSRTPDPEEWLRAARALTPQSIASAVRDSLDSLIVGVDDWECLDTELLAAKLGLAYRTELPGRPTAEKRRGLGRLWRGGLFSGGGWIRLHNDRLIVHQIERTYELALSEVVVAGRNYEGELALIDRRGGHDVILLDNYRHGDALDGAILERVPPQAVRDFSWHDSRPELLDEDQV